MKVIGLCFLYCLFTLAYVWYPFEGNNYLFLFNSLTTLGFIAILCHLTLTVKNYTEDESLFIQYLMWLTLSRLAYTAYCVFMEREWILYHTNVYNVLIGVSFVVVLITIALKKS